MPVTYGHYVIASYKKDRTTGADFARQMQVMSRLGFRTRLIETDELATVEENAGVVADEILRLGERLPPESLPHVRAWVSVGGILRGSPLADGALGWPRRWIAAVAFRLRGLRASVIPSLSTAVRRPAFSRLRIPDHILTLQYVGVPLTGQVEDSVRDRYETLRGLGPNDGLTLLADELVTDVGLDHYFRDAAIDRKTIALDCVTIAEIERRARSSKRLRDEGGPPCVAGDDVETVSIADGRRARQGARPACPGTVAMESTSE